MSSGISLVAHWDLSIDNPPDICWRGNRYPGVGTNIVGHPNGIAGGRCAEFNGDNSIITIGDVAELISVEKFTIAFWMNQDILDMTDVCCQGLNGKIAVYPSSSGKMYFQINGTTDRGYFDYSTIISAGEWHHVAMVFDGSRAGNANRLVACIDGIPVALTFDGTIPAITSATAGTSFSIGRALASFDGKLDEFMIFDDALTNLQVVDLYERQRKGII